MLLILVGVLASQPAALVQASPSASSNRDFLLRNYPPAALQKGEQGPVGFEATVEGDGFMSGCTIVKSSGFASLDRGTCEFLAQYGKFPTVVDSEGNRVRATHEGRINWQLPAGRVQPASARIGGAPDRLELICKRFARTGSKVRKVKVCYTPLEWKYHDQAVRQELERSPRAPGISR